MVWWWYGIGGVDGRGGQLVDGGVMCVWRRKPDGRFSVGPPTSIAKKILTMNLSKLPATSWCRVVGVYMLILYVYIVRD